MPDHMDHAQENEERWRAEALRRHLARMARMGIAAPPPPPSKPAEDDA